ncbi:laminin subunit gamma-1-like, partial [Notothenia coriiceps]|uniref:Laminin subunit gamma-1-like n=1 Tax=Notothenia coriiceps TaxID=8208 RepID=A0A6I9PYB0_9TELE
FDQQIGDSKSLADDAIKRLPGISAIIQQAVSDNAETGGILGDVSADYDSSVKTANLLGNLVTGLENTFGSLPSHTDLLNEATKLNKGSKDLKQRTLDATDNLTSELEDGRRLEGEAEQAAGGAAAALINSKNTRDGVGKTLRDINALLAKMDQSTPVDETQLRALEVALDEAQQEVQGRLGPRLRDMEAGEEAYRRRLSGLNWDIGSILKDITNLEDILASVPSGCYNSPPIEEA